MLILLNLAGQTSNHFLQHTHLDAFCKKNNIIFYNPNFNQYKKQYPHLKLFPSNRLIGAFFLNFIFRIVKRMKGFEIIDFDDDEKAEYYASNPKLLKWRIVYCQGWRFRSNQDVEIYRNDFRFQFQPQDEVKK